MEKPFNIVVVVNRSADADFVLQKAAALAKSNEQRASVHVIRVMYEEFVGQTHLAEDKAQALKLYLMQAEEEFLVDLVEEYRSSFKNIETATIWNKRVSEAVANVAESFDADLIIKSADPESPHFPRHPDDWNLLRDAKCPVFLVKPEAWPDTPVILAGVNVSDEEHQQMNRRILEAGAILSRAVGGQLHVVNALAPMNPLLAGAEFGVDFAKLERDAKTAVTEMIDGHLKSLDVGDIQIHVESGQAARLVSDVAEEIGAAAIVVGTAGRHGVSGMVIGNTSEKLLHTLHQDLLVLHV